METTLSQLLLELSTYSILIPIIIGLPQIKGMSLEKRLLFAYILIRAVSELLANFLGNGASTGNGMYTCPLLHIYTMVEFSLLAWMIGSRLQPIITRIHLGILLAVFIIGALLNGFFGEGFHHFNPYFRALEGIILIALGILYFIKTLKELRIPRLELEPMTWVSFGTIFYFSGSLFLFLTSNALDSIVAQFLSMTIWGIHALLNILFNLFLALGLWVRPASNQAADR